MAAREPDPRRGCRPGGTCYLCNAPDEEEAPRCGFCDAPLEDDQTTYCSQACRQELMLASRPIPRPQPTAPVVVGCCDAFDSDDCAICGGRFPRPVSASRPEPESAPESEGCGCVLCACADEERCHGCGAKFCDKHAPRPAPRSEEDR